MPKVASVTRVLSLLASFVVVIVAASCGESPVETPYSAIRGLNQSVAIDSTGAAAPGAPTDGPGHFHGTVLGPSPVGATGDTLASAPRVSNVVVVAYPLLARDGAEVELGDAAATAITGADGKFTLPTLPGGEYVVTFTPPADGPYGGVWVTAMAHSGSHAHPWWVVLWTR